MNNTNPTKTSQNIGTNSDARERLAVLLHMWHPSSYFGYKQGDKS